MCDIPYSIDFIKQNGIYEIRIDNIYDPSKFWVIIHFNERKVFNDFLSKFYEKNGINMAHHHIRRYSSCIIRRNSRYYRAVILPSIFQEETKFRVFFVDYGQIVHVMVEDMFYIFKEHTAVPRFAIRASLFGDFDANSSWTISELQLFILMICDQELYAQVKEVDSGQKVLHLEIYAIKNSIQICINNKMNKIIEANCNCDKNGNKKYKSKVKYLKLIPTFYALEGGMVPCSLWEQNLLKYIPLDLLYKQYYTYNNNT